MLEYRYNGDVDTFLCLIEYRTLYLIYCIGEAERIKEELNGNDNPDFTKYTYKYHLVVRPGELVGVQLGVSSVSSMILTQIM